ncbi:retention module-containing protein, partial [Vibrio sp. WXL103]|uniref:retention module-containing protein n=1 Tax=Vibrio sp. WXL103 TaxID=3450710 RepID=UPI003EC682CE
MDIKTNNQNVIVEQVEGNVVAISANGSSRTLSKGDVIQSGEITITPAGGLLVVAQGEQVSQLTSNVVATLSGDILAAAEVDGNIAIEPTKPTNFEPLDIFAIQQAILDGVDPTEILDTAAGEPQSDAANAGFISIEYKYAEALASTFFETAAPIAEQEIDDEARDNLIPAVGGGLLELSMTEANISGESSGESLTVSGVIQAGEVPLDPTSFVPDPDTLSTLLDELSSEITSSGAPVTFFYDQDSNTIIGESSDGEVVRIEIAAQPSGNGDVLLSVTTTLSQPIDHIENPEQGAITIVDDQLAVDLVIVGQDEAGIDLTSPINVTVTISDGADPTATPAEITTLESDNTPISGSVLELGSDELQSIRFQPSAIDNLSGILSDNQPTVATLSDDGTSILLTLENSDQPLLEIVLELDGSFTVTQFGPLEHPQTGTDTEAFLLPIVATDFDQDTVGTSLTINIQDGADPIVTGASRVNLSETNLPDGNDPDAALLTGTGTITTEQGSDDIDHYEVDVATFNQTSSLTAFGQPVVLDGPEIVDGQYIYRGYVTLNGERVDVLSLSLNEDGEYSIELLQPVDHRGQDDGTIVFDIPVYAVDTDGDRSALSEDSNIEVTIADDTQTLADGRYVVTEPTVAGENQVTHQVITNDGADGASVVSFIYRGEFETEYTLDPSIDGEQRFEVEYGTLFVTNEGAVRFVPDRNIDHSQAEQVFAEVEFTVRDNDGDEANSRVELTIVDGQGPEVDSVSSLVVNEAELADGTQSSGAVVSASGVVSVVVGSDDIDHFEIDHTQFNSLSPVNSLGQPVSMSAPVEVTDPDTGAVSYVYMGTVTLDNAISIDVFQITVNADGSYVFELYQALDHQGEEDDSLDFTIPIYAVDNDGDPSATAGVVVTVADDQPVVADVATLPVTEPTLEGENATEVHDFLVQQGADGAAVISFVYDGDGTSEPFVLDQSQTDYQPFEVEDGIIFIKTTGEMYFEPNRNLDHSAGEIIDSYVTATVVDGDGDTYSAEANIEIRDGADPTITAITPVLFSESNLLNGSNPNASALIGSGNISVALGSDDIDHFEIDVDAFNQANTIVALGMTATLGNPVIVTDPQTEVSSYVYTASVTLDDNSVVDVFQVSVEQGGQYTLELFESLDHSDNDDSLSFDIPVFAIDTDGDPSTVNSLTNISVTVIDDEPIVPNDVELLVTEPIVVGDNETITHDFLTQEGADGASVVSFVYQGDATSTPFVLDQADPEYQAFDVEDGTVYIKTSGEMYFEPSRDLDHSNEEALSTSVTATIIDGDGDTYMPVANIVIEDGQDPVITAVSPASFDEANLPDGNSPDSDALVVTGSVDATVGSDDIVRYEVDITSFNSTSPIEAFGKPVTLGTPFIVTDSVNGTTSYVYNATVTLDDDTVVDIFQVAIDEQGNYRIELFEPIDHEDGSSEDDQLSFNLPVFAVDSDGDPSELTPLTNIAVTVLDDEATVASTTAALEVTEPVTSGDNETAVHDFLITEGADGASVVSFVYQGDATSDPFTLDQANPEYQAFDVEDGTVYIKTSGEMYFEPSRDLDHSSEEILSTSITATIIDADGDTFTPVANIDIEDGQDPVITAVSPASFDEANLIDGNSPDSEALVVMGSINATTGSDDIVRFEVDITTFNTAAPIEALGKTVVLGTASVVTDAISGVTSYVYDATVTLDDDSVVDIFQVSIDEEGNYRIELFEPIDHEDGSSEDDQLSFNLPVLAVDSDGDPSESTALTNIAVTVVDDEATVASTSAALEVTEPVTSGDNATDVHDFLATEGADGASVVSFVYQGDATRDPFILDQADPDYQDFAVEDGTVYIKTSGEMYFEPSRDLDHSGEEILSTSVTATIIDGDGDTYMPVANITIEDGQDPVITAVAPTSFDEANLADGNSPDSDALVVTGSISATTGSDDIVRFEVDTATFNSAAPIEALGKPVVVGSANVVTDPVSGVVSYVYDATVTLDDDSVVDIFQVSIDEDGNYSIELFEPIDHEDGSSEDDQLSFNLPVFAVDSDGDPSESSPQTNIAVTVVDDEATVASTSAALEVTEPVTSGDNATDVHDFLTTEGADGASVVSFVYQGDAISDPFILDQADPEYQDFAVEDGTVYIKTSGEMYFEPSRDLDHSGEEILSTSVTATIIDGDGDTYMPVANINIEDGQDPVITAVAPASFDEANLVDGNSPDSDALVVTG